MSTHKEITEAWDEQQRLLVEKFDPQVRERLVSLNGVLRRFKFENLICGMGTWTVNGPNFIADYGDGEEDDLEIECLFEWAYSDKVYDPKDLTKEEEAALKEFCDLCEWWVETTGGDDISFPVHPET